MKDAVFFIAILVAAIATYILWRRIGRRFLARQKGDTIRLLWSELDRHTEISSKLIAADTILDLALSKIGYTGTIEEKLMAAKGAIKSTEAIERAHALAKKLAEGSAPASLTNDEVTEALDAYSETLKNLNFLSS